jgi:hypothetical protein
MARQRGLIRLVGNIGDINYYRSKDGYFAREGSRLDADRIATDPRFKLTRQNNAEFATTATAAKVLRNAIGSLLMDAKDGSVYQRMFREMMKVVKADATSTRGQRNVVDGEAELLQGFEFNINAILSTMLFAPWSAGIDRATGLLSVNIPSFIPDEVLIAPVTATHFKLVSLGTEVNFESGEYVTEAAESAILPWNLTATGNINLEMHVTANSPHPLFLLFGLQFFQEVNGNLSKLKDGTFNSLAIIKVSGV